MRRDESEGPRRRMVTKALPESLDIEGVIERYKAQNETLGLPWEECWWPRGVRSRQHQ